MIVTSSTSIGAAIGTAELEEEAGPSLQCKATIGTGLCLPLHLLPFILNR